MRGLNSKTKSFYLKSNACDYDVIALTETWLSPSVNDSELFSQDFIVFRCDRSALNSHKLTGGGVLIAVRKEYEAEVVIVPNIESVEALCIKISVAKKYLFICCVYIPSNSDLSIYRK